MIVCGGELNTIGDWLTGSIGRGPGLATANVPSPRRPPVAATFPSGESSDRRPYLLRTEKTQDEEEAIDYFTQTWSGVWVPMTTPWSSPPTGSGKRRRALRGPPA